MWFKFYLNRQLFRKNWKHLLELNIYHIVSKIRAICDTNTIFSHIKPIPVISIRNFFFQRKPIELKGGSSTSTAINYELNCFRFSIFISVPLIFAIVLYFAMASKDETQELSKSISDFAVNLYQVIIKPKIPLQIK